MWLGDLFDDAMSFAGDKIGDALDYVQEKPYESALIGLSALTGGAALAYLGPALGTTALSAVSGSSLGGGGLAAGAATAGGSAVSSLVNAAASTGTKAAIKTAVKTAAAASLANLGESLLDEVFFDKVKPVKGSIVYCDLALIAEHSGVYIGGGRIAHLDGSGTVEIVTAKTFLKRLGGYNPAMRIYVSCDEDGAVGSQEIAKRAKAAAGKNRDYNLILDNCHQFASGCISGDFENADNFLCMLKHTAQNSINATNWRVWDLSSQV